MKYFNVNPVKDLSTESGANTDIISIILTLFFVFFSADSLVFGTNANEFFVRIKYLFFYIVFFYLLIKTTKQIKKERFTFLLVFVGIIVFNMVINLDLRLGYFQKIIVIIASFLYCQLYSLKKFAYLYVKIMYFLVEVAIVFEVSYIILPWIAKRFILINVAGVRFYTWFIANIQVTPGGVIRNFGFAREPGVFVIFIILALLFETFVNDEKSIRKIIVFIIGVLSTISTSGYIALAFYLVALMIYIDKFNFNNKNKIRMLLILLICFILYLALGTDLLFGEQYGSAFGKLNSRNVVTRGSFYARYASIVSNIYIGFQNVIFGKGITYVDENFSNVSWDLLQVNVRDNANTLFIHLAQYGFIFFLMQLYGLIRTVNSFSESKEISAFCLLSYLAVSMGQTLIASPIFFVMLFLRNEENHHA